MSNGTNRWNERLRELELHSRRRAPEVSPREQEHTFIDHYLRPHLAEARDEAAGSDRLDGEIQSLTAAGWQVRDDLDVIVRRGSERLVLRVAGVKPLFEAAAHGQADRPLVQIVSDSIEQLQHTVPGGLSELSRLAAFAPPDQPLDVELVMEKIAVASGDDWVDGWSVVVP